MLIGQLSVKSGLTRDTIRFYEKRGLIPSGQQESQFNNYKDYSEEILHKLYVIKKMKGFGFTLNEIAEFLGLLDLNSASCANVSKKMFDKIMWIDQKIEELKEIKNVIFDGIRSCQPAKDKPGNCPLISVD